MDRKEHWFVFGVFNGGKLVFPIGEKQFCNHNVAKIIVRLLDKVDSHDILAKGDYFACDYAKNHNI